jgi:putative ABC transport system permease protein
MIFLRNVHRAWLRSLMTVLGIAGGVALFAAILAMTTDLQKQLRGAIGAYSLEVVVYERRATSPFSSKISGEQMQSLRQHFGTRLTPIVVGTLNEKWNAYAMVVGVEPGFSQRIPLVVGERFKPGRREIVLGEIGAQRLQLQPGQSLRLDGDDYTISGVFRTGSRMFDGAVMTGIADAQKMLSQGGTAGQYTMALLQTTSHEDKDRFIGEVQARFPGLRAIPGTEFAGSLRLLKVVDTFAYTISLVALMGTCLLVTNTLLMAVAERTREIGILMTVGWTPWLVLRMLLAESLLLCALGTGVGNVLAVLLLRVVNGMESIGYGWLPVSLPPTLVLGSFVATAMVAVVALIWPAVVVWRLQPLSALRHE